MSMKTRAVRWGRYLGGALLLALILLGTGWPQRWLVRSVIRNSLGVPQVAVSGVSVLGRLRVDELRVYGRLPDSASVPPTVQLDGLNLDYRLLAKDGRHVDSLTLNTLSVFVETDESQTTNYEFFRKAFSRSNGESAPSYLSGVIPQRVNIARIRGEAAFPSLGLTMDGLSLDASVTSVNDFSATLRANPLSGNWRRKPAPANPYQGIVAIELRRTPEALAADPLRINIPGFAEVRGAFHAGFEPNAATFALSLEECMIQALDLADARGVWLPAPITFDALDLSGSSVNGVWSGTSFSLPDSRIKAAVTNLRVGTPDALLYAGDLRLDGKTAAENASRFDASVSFGGAPSAGVTLEGTPDNLRAVAAIPDWSREQWTALLPQAYRGVLDALPNLRRMSANIEIVYTPAQLRAGGLLKPVTGDSGATHSLGVELEAPHAVAGPGPPWPTTARLFFPKKPNAGSAQANLFLADVSGQFAANVTCSSLDLAYALTAFGITDGTGNLAAKLTGAASLRQSTLGREVKVDLTSASLGYGAFMFPEALPVSLRGVATADTAFAQWFGDTLDAKVGEGATLAINRWKFSRAPLSFTGNVTAHLALDVLAPALGVTGLRGEADVKTPLRYDKGIAHLTPAISAVNLVYGSIAAPYGTPITGGGDLRYDSGAGRLTASKVHFSLGEGTRLTAATLSLQLQSLALYAPFAFQTDFAPLVDMGLLDRAAGHARLAGSITRNEGGVMAGGTMDVQANSLVLQNALAGLGGLALKADINYGKGLTGGGTLRAANVVAAGSTLRDLSASFTFHGERMETPDLTAALFGGTVTAKAAIGLLQPGFPMSVSGSVSGLDLGVFTREFRPPGTALTGRASGEFSVEFEAAALKDLRVDLRSTEGFTMNRDMVQQLLVSGAIKGFTGAKTLEGVMTKVVGKADQRPFDRAEVALAFTGGRITGQAVLKSKDLNLTIDLKADPAALRAAMELRQRNQLQNIANITAEPLQF